MTDIMNTSSPSSESGKNVILKVSENSDAQLEDLFKVLNAGDGSSQNSRRRGLPSSLYEEPNKDEQPKTNIIGPAVQLPQNPAFGSGRNSSHSRVISLPADLNRYPRGDQFDYHNIPLPPGWEIGKTAESHTYFINHNERRTQWEDPRLQMMGLPRGDHMAGGMVTPHNILGAQPPYTPQQQTTPTGSLTHMAGHQPTFPHYSQHRHINNQSLDHTQLGGMGGIAEGGDPRSHLHPLMSHQYSQSYGGPVHRPMSSVPAPMGGHYPGMHVPLSSKRSYDLTMMEHGPGGKPPVTLGGDPYLSEHARQASHDSGLGYPYQGDQGMMEFDDTFDGGLHSLPPHPGMPQEQGGPPNHGLMDPLQGPPGGEVESHPQMDFGQDMLGDFPGNQGMFGSNTWV